MEYEIWCRCLRQYREQKELTQQAVADGIDISRSHYSAIEHGRTVINYKHLYNLAKYFKVHISDLMVFRMLNGKKGRLTRLPVRGRPKRKK
jgi:transcriptional regulator with XRE-family HTH domain